MMLFMLINKPHKRHMESPKDFLIKKLNLDNKQRISFLELDKEHKSKMMFYDAEIIKLKKSMFLSFSSSDKVDKKIVLKIGELTTKKENEIYTFFKKIKAICNPEQLSSLEEVIQRAILHSGISSHRANHISPPSIDGERCPPPPPG